MQGEGTGGTLWGKVRCQRRSAKELGVNKVETGLKMDVRAKMQSEGVEPFHIYTEG